MKVLGRTTCDGHIFRCGDLNGDGIVSEREALRLLYMYTVGRNWGAQFDSWANPAVDKCELTGVDCVDDSVAKLDLTDAAMCSDGERGISFDCKGIPAEISLLSNLEVLVLNRRQFLRSLLPSELGKLEKLRYLDLSNCPFMTGQVSCCFTVSCFPNGLPAHHIPHFMRCSFPPRSEICSPCGF